MYNHIATADDNIETSVKEVQILDGTYIAQFVRIHAISVHASMQKQQMMAMMIT